MTKRIFRNSVAALVTCAGILALAVSRENDFIFWPTKKLVRTPAESGMAYEEVVLSPVAGSQRHIHGWFIPCVAPRAVILYLEGNGGNRSDRMGPLKMLHDLRCSVLIIDYEGYDGSSGRPSEQAVYRDARAARAWIASNPATQELPEVLYGESLGGAVACRMAREKPPRALIIDHSFTSMKDMANFIGHGLPLGWICRSSFNSLDNIAHYHGPVLIFHGDQDPTIPISQAYRLFKAANQPKRLVVIPGGTHDLSQLLQIGAPLYREAIEKMIEDLSVEGRERSPGNSFRR